MHRGAAAPRTPRSCAKSDDGGHGRRYAEHLFVRPRTLSLVLAVLGLVVAGPSAWAQERTPTPKELWEAYPLDPDKAPASQLPSATPAEFGAAPQAGSEGGAADEDGSGIPLVVPITLAALLAFGAGVALGRRRRSQRAAAVEAAADPPPAEPAPPKRFVARDYPPPARPAPPAPPVPARPAQFEAGLETEERQPAARPVPQRPGTGGQR